MTYVHEDTQTFNTNQPVQVRQKSDTNYGILHEHFKANNRNYDGVACYPFNGIEEVSNAEYAKYATNLSHPYKMHLGAYNANAKNLEGPVKVAALHYAADNQLKCFTIKQDGSYQEYDVIDGHEIIMADYAEVSGSKKVTGTYIIRWELIVVPILRK